MKPNEKPMFTTLLFCLMASQAVETQTPALETVHTTTYSSQDEQEPQKNNLNLNQNNEEFKEKKPYIFPDKILTKNPKKDPPCIEVEDPIPKKI